MSALARWDAFLAQIEARHRQVVGEAEAAAHPLIAGLAPGGDHQPLSHQLSAATARLKALVTTIADTWHAKVDAAISDEGLGVGAREAAWAKGEAVRHRLDDATDELEPRIFAELARQRFAHAQAQARPVGCVACGAALPVVPSSRHHEVACACGALTLVAPSELLQSVAAIGAHALAQQAALSPWRAMRAAERRLHAIRPPRELAVVVELERCQIAYWRAYLTTRAQLEPELHDLALEIRSRMEAWYVSHAEYEEAWVRAGRPRLPI